MDEATKPCGRCGRRKPEADWHPAQWRRRHAGAWCKACYQDRHRERYVPRDGANDEPRACEWCSETYRPKRRTVSRFCSRKCKDRARAPKPTERPCGHCAKLFVPRRRTHRMCSRACSKAAHRLQSRLRSRTGESTRPGVLRAAIAERDEWLCGICGEPVDRDLLYPDPLCASLDHIVPVSRGGRSEPGNLRLAHMGCNRSRGNRHELELFVREALVGDAAG